MIFGSSQRTPVQKDILNYDFCPWANRYVYWLKSPLAQLLLAACAAAFIGYAIVPQGYIALGGLLIVIIIGLAWPGIALLGIQAALSFEQQRITENNTIIAKIVVRNRWPWPVWGLSVAGFAHDADDSHDDSSLSVEIGLACVPGWSQVEFRWNYTPVCRGIYPAKPPILFTEFPFGLWRKRRTIEVAQQLVVWPATYPVRLEAQRPLTVWQSENSRKAMGGSDGEMLGTRYFRQGDSLRQIHWSQTARHNRLISREFQVANVQAVGILVDTATDVHNGTGPNSTREWAIRIGASLAHSCTKTGQRWELRIGNTYDFQHLSWGKVADRIAALDSESLKSTRFDAFDSSSILVVVTTRQRYLQQIAKQDALQFDLCYLLDERQWDAEAPSEEPDSEIWPRNVILVRSPNEVARHLQSRQGGGYECYN